ncbi:MAG: WD40 repeat domain-containing protein [Kofleriaceae bacterium]|nr:WD40 repeat domain-containing protein [Kofleriaceae bacterium]
MRISTFMAVALLYLATGCVAPVASRLPSDVATSLREKPMRRMETDSLLLYYPAARRDNALRIAERLESCATALRSQAKIHNDYADQKMVIIVPDVPFNNAFVAPSVAGLPHFSVIPTSNTLDFTSELGMPPDPSFVGCHEITHYVQLLQAKGLWGWLNKWVGNVMSPQIGLDSWFLEGLATYYESRLQPGAGRMAWPAWRGYFHAAFAQKRINGGDLSTFQRPFHWGNQYLVGSHFVDFLAKRYGEEALWKLIQEQGDSIFFPFGTALRWKSATKKTLPALVDEFADYVQNVYVVRAAPATQKHVHNAGNSARYAVSPTGREALISASADKPTRLTIYENGKVLRERNLVDILPPRTLSVANPILTSGLSFSQDGNDLYFVALDSGHVQLESRLLRYRINSDKLEEVLGDLGGTGGSLSRDGNSYFYASADGDKRHVAELDLATKTARIVREAGPRSYYGEIRQSPDKSKLVASYFDGKSFAIRVLNASSGQTLTELRIAGAVHDPSWVDQHRILLLAEFSGRFQLHVYDLRTRQLTRVSDAPYLAFQPRPFQGKFRFLNRKGWDWSINSVPDKELSVVATIPSPAEIAPGAEQAPNVRVHSDKPYSQLDNLFSPSLRTPTVLAGPQKSTIVGLSLSGADRLFTHRWSAAGYLNPESREVSGQFAYGTSILAPADMQVYLGQFSWQNGDNETIQRQREGGVSVTYPFRSGATFLSFSEFQVEEPLDADLDKRFRRLSGPSLGIQFAAIESTAYSGPRRGYSLSAQAGYFASALNSLDADIGDLQASLRLWTPLPFSRRHTLSLGLRGRRQYGLSRNDGLLDVGGTTALYRAVQRNEPESESEDNGAPDFFGYSVPLRGFEDLQFHTNKIAIAQLAYRYPLILDFGISHTAYLLPSLQFRQLDLQLFGTGAIESFKNYSDREKLAAGFSLDLAVSIWLVPFAVRYQMAKRLTDDEAIVHSITIEI